MTRGRRLIGVLCLLALVVIGLGVMGVELSLPRFGAGDGQSERPPQGVRVAAATPLVRVGVEAPANGELASLAVEPSGNLVVSDRQRQSVLRFDATGHLLSEWGPRLESDVAIDEPAGIATFEDVIYVLDRGRPRIFVLDTSGRLLNTFDLQSLGTYGLNGLAVDPSGNLYAADTGRNRILMFSPGGTLLQQIGRGGSGLGEFTQPMALSFAADGSFFVADWENSRIQRFDAARAATDAWSGGFRPFGIAVDAAGRVFAPDTERRRLFAYTPKGGQLGELGGQGSAALTVAPRQLATSRAHPLSLFVLGDQGIVRLDLENIEPPPQSASASEIDLLSPILILVLLAIPILALLARRRRASVGAPLDGKVRLQAEDGAQRQHQQPGGDEDLALTVTHQADHQQQPAQHDHQTVRDRKPDHQT
jgi:hypothetical protein